nr:winged helix-turn-helix domain-containing protein [Gordonia sp. SID5947]
MSDDSSDRIAQHLRSVAAAAEAGSRLPSTRALASRFGAGPVTVQRALAQLVAEGVVETRSGSGTFVRRRSAASGRADVAWQTAALGPERAGASSIGSTMRQIPTTPSPCTAATPTSSCCPPARFAALSRESPGGRTYSIVRPPPVCPTCDAGSSTNSTQTGGGTPTR